MSTLQSRVRNEEGKDNSLRGKTRRENKKNLGAWSNLFSSEEDEERVRHKEPPVEEPKQEEKSSLPEITDDPTTEEEVEDPWAPTQGALDGEEGVIEKKPQYQIPDAPEYSGPRRKQAELTEIDRDSLNQKRREILDTISRAKEMNAWGQIAETLGHAMTMWSAANYGLKHGVDMSGLKMNKTDWEKKLDTAMRHANIELDNIDKTERAAERDAERKDTASQRALDLEYQDERDEATQKHRAEMAKWSAENQLALAREAREAREALVRLEIEQKEGKKVDLEEKKRLENELKEKSKQLKEEDKKRQSHLKLFREAQVALDDVTGGRDEGDNPTGEETRKIFSKLRANGVISDDEFNKLYKSADSMSWNLDDAVLYKYLDTRVKELATGHLPQKETAPAQTDQRKSIKEYQAEGYTAAKDEAGNIWLIKGDEKIKYQ